MQQLSNQKHSLVFSKRFYLKCTTKIITFADTVTVRCKNKYINKSITYSIK